MPEFKYAKGRIEESLQFISEEIKEFENEYMDKTWVVYQNDKKTQKLIDRTVENILTALVEICGTILTNQNIPIENYAQVLGECAKLFGFDDDEQKSLSKLAAMRNRLAHRYLNFKWQTIKIFNETRPLVLKLLAVIVQKTTKM